MSQYLLPLCLCLFLSIPSSFGCQGGDPAANCDTFEAMPTAPPSGIQQEPVMVTKDVEVSKRTRRLANQFARRVQQGQLARNTDDALNAIIRLAAYKMKREGYHSEADSLVSEWESHWRGYVVMYAGSGLRVGIGSHVPLSTWLASKYNTIEFVLGKDICHMLRLDDIKTINYGIPVVFKCVDQVSEAEYKLHFVSDTVNGYRGLAPVASYWISFFVCVGGTWGTGFLFCSPIAMGIEFLVLEVAAPHINHWAWTKACHITGEEWEPYPSY